MRTSHRIWKNLGYLTMSSVMCFGTAWADSNEKLEVLPLSNKNAPGVLVKRGVRSHVRFEGREYDPSEGIPILMSIIQDRDDRSDRRVSALISLGHNAQSIESGPIVQKLVGLYPELRTTELKMELLRCIAICGDKGGVALLHKVLNTESEDLVLFVAALGLAEWNIRSGVEELARLLCADIVPEQYRLPLKFEVLKSLQSANTRKSWGFDWKATHQQILSGAADNPERQLELWCEAWNQWFDENKRRFPEWKPPVKEEEKSRQKAR